MIPGPEEVYGVLDSRFPFDSAYDWDNSGWQIAATRPIQRCLVALDPSVTAVEKAIEWQAQLLLTHHPLFLPHLSSIHPQSSTGAITKVLLASDTGLLASHSCADRHIDGISGALADAIGLECHQVLAPDAKGTLYKLVTFVPDDYLGPVRTALAAAGAGVIGNYEECSFTLAGIGTYRPQKGARPMQGEIGQLEMVDEHRLEMRVPEAAVAEVLKALQRYHPYDEVAFDLFRTFAQGDQLGIGVLGTLPKAKALNEVIDHIKEALGGVHLKVTGPEEGTIEVVAVAAGSAGDFVPIAAGRGAQLFLGGDLKYHKMLDYSGSIVCVDPGHRATEQPGVERLADVLRHAAVQNNWELEVETFLEDPAFGRFV